jgi:hypothetical protein
MHSIYIESADEITTVIERLKDAPDEAVALVAPKGATLLQSVVNLKLARKAATDAGKTITLVTTDKIGRNLCTQLGIPVVGTEEEATAAFAGSPSASDGLDADPKIVAGVRVHHYYDEEAADADTGAIAPEPIIIPKQILTKQSTEEPVNEPIAVPEEVPTGTPASSDTVEPLARRTIPREDAPVVAAATASIKPLKEKSAKSFSGGQRRILKLSLFLTGVALLGLAVIALLFLPITEVTLKVRATDWQRTLAFTAATGATQTSADNLVVPAELVAATSDGSLTFDATGTKKVGEKAAGTITFYNYDSTSPVTVPTGTRITASGKTFVTTTAESVPGFTQAGGGQPRVPGKKAVSAIAEEVGPESNVNEATGVDIRVNNILLSSTVTTTGGSSRDVKVVSNDDLIRAKEALTSQLKGEATTKLAASLSNRQVIAKEDADLVEVSEVSSDALVGAEVGNATVTGSVTIRRTVVNLATLEGALSERLATDQRSDRSYEITTKNYTITRSAEDGTELALEAAVEGKEAPIINKVALPQKLAGSTLAEGERIVQEAAPTTSVELRHGPAWWPLKRYPTLDRYITVIVKYE